MAYFAKLNDENIVESVIVADAQFINNQSGIWIETFVDDPSKQYAGIGYGWNGLEFLPQPFSRSTWAAQNKTWVTPDLLGFVRNVSPIITADGLDHLQIYVTTTPLTSVTVVINGESLVLTTDARGYVEFELSSDTTGLIVISWGDFTLEVAAI